MPELPDVEGQRRLFRRHAAGKRVLSLSAIDEILRNSSPQASGRAIKGHRFENPERHGKWLLCPTDEPILIFHFGMTGELVWASREQHEHSHDRLVLHFGDGELRYRAMRKLGGVWLARNRDEIPEVTGPLGPDALRVSRRDFIQRVGDRRGSIKAALMDQRPIAGLGNLTVDESLWRARIAPGRSAAELDDKELIRLHGRMRRVLTDSVKEGRVPPKRSWLTGVRDTKSPHCPRCGTPLDRSRIAGRTTYWCPVCQPA
ncbi:MAG: Fpg/Nei family DNA glycosylase [Actinomycetota bacterium]